MRNFEKNISFYINNYDSEKMLYKKGKIWGHKGWLTKKEFMTICLWKSRRPKRFYSRNTSNKIIQTTKKAFKERDEYKKMEILTRLRGVNIPTASAILSIINPRKYPIIDIRCVESLRDLKKITWKTITHRSWEEYLSLIRKIAKAERKTARNIEKGLFAYNRIKLDEDLRNLYN